MENASVAERKVMDNHSRNERYAISHNLYLLLIKIKHRSPEFVSISLRKDQLLKGEDSTNLNTNIKNLEERKEYRPHKN